ncbi:carboxypeptidase-like regulatory domain-containing protein [Paractinoplanes hotanensis]|uniref:Carboxypeptidase-like regulatory domain-containing protein n=1 Tax=Paractinoplanes hotanensis TaxID=2906497 RepID=A0ABT0Y6M1_9ACTN|nr:carboxypeptidase-like regulatory domain-containing protein [Actinoplanes hotanensis]MCM4081683.1 carboxypeptidase-like regulatory domain-containing protein [Actinoplanes hotanensis]
MVTTHLRARATQAGALLAVVLGGIFVAPAVALADPPNVQITDLQTEVLSGGRLTMQFQVAEGNGSEIPVPANVTVNGGGMDCRGGDCSRRTTVDGNGRQFSVQLTAPNVNAGETRQVTVEITANVQGEQPGRASQQITIKGPDRPQSVRQVSGRVKDQDGKSIAGATVGMQDSAGSVFQGTSDGSGQYSFRSTDSKPISPGRISIGAGKNGFEEVTVQREAQANQNLTISLTLKSTAPATPSPTPTPSPSATSAAPTEEVSEQATPEEETATEQATDQAASTEDDGGSMLYIIIGVLLVAAGIGAIVLVVLRRRNSADNDGDDDPTGLSGSGGVVPPSRGGFTDATRVGAPVGGGRNDATMIAPAPRSAAMADAPTMIHRPVPAVEDEFPDPYGVPLPQHGGYAGAAAGGWDQGGNQGGNQYGAGTQQYGGGTQPYDGGAQQPYGEATSYGRPPEDNGYAAGAQQGGGYGAYGEATGMYRPEADDDGGYGNQPYGGTNQYSAGQYGAEPVGGYPAGGYGQEPADQGGYGSWGAAGDGLDNNGYGPQGGGQPYGGGQTGPYGSTQPYGGDPASDPAGGGPAGQPYGGGYDQGYQAGQPGSYDQGYQPGSGYDDQYGNQPGGHDQRGGRPDAPAPRRGNHDY